MKRVLIIGGYGNFGSYIARSLARDPNIALLIGGRSQTQADALASSLGAVNPAQGCALDIDSGLSNRMLELRPDIVIHTTGPFQAQDYRVARAAIAAGAHYLDLADARAFVAGIGTLDADARRRRVAVISGASSVPCLSAAITDHYCGEFNRIEELDYGISAAQQTNRGLATAASILSYLGRPFAILRNGRWTRVFGWQTLHPVTYPELGRRWFGNCDIPDLELFPRRYPTVRTVRFAAGHEIAALHFGTWLLSWIVRTGLLRDPVRIAPQLLRASFLFDALGSSRSGMHIFLSGVGHDGAHKRIRVFIVARQGHGSYIPCMPAIILAKRLAAGERLETGARPCLDLIDLPTYLGALRGLDISLVLDGADAPS